MLYLYVLLCWAVKASLGTVPVLADVSPLAVIGPVALLGLGVVLAIGLICVCISVLIKTIQKKKQNERKEE